MCIEYKDKKKWYDKYALLCSEILACVEKLEKAELGELNYYNESIKGLQKRPFDVERLKAVYAIAGISDEELDEFLKFVETSRFGWQDGTYMFSNTCLRKNPGNNCKDSAYEKTFSIDSWRFQGQIDGLSLFNDEKNYNGCGNISIMIIAYCISALFASVLNRCHQKPPMYLQIACQKESTTYALIEELVDICDVNSGSDGVCHFSAKANKNRRCEHSTHKYYPRSLKYDLAELSKEYRDTPVIISGFENQRNYRVLMREIANMAGKTRSFKPKFDVIPLFVSDVIHSEFDNILCLDLTNITVDPKFILSIRENKSWYASLVYAIVRDDSKILSLHSQEGNSETRMEKDVSHFWLDRDIDEYKKEVEALYPNASPKIVGNVGVLAYFFRAFLNAWLYIYDYDDDDDIRAIGKYTYKKRDGSVSECYISSFREIAMKDVILELVEIHQRFLPTAVLPKVQDNEALKLANIIAAEYKKLKVNVNVIPIETNTDRFTFEIQTKQATKDSWVKDNAETVQRRLKKYEYFRILMNPSEPIKLIVSEKYPKDNNLSSILNSEEFKNTNMKIPIAIGYDDTGNAHIEDLAGFPHLLILGETNSGKSTAICNLLMSIASKCESGNVNVVVMDFLGKNPSKYSMFNNSPFMIAPVITAVQEGKCVIDQLYRLLESNRVNQFQNIVCIIDEFPSFFTQIDDSAERNQYNQKITSLLSKGRHSNIHIVLSSQTLDKRYMHIDTNNFPTKMIFRLSSAHYSERYLGKRGAETLRGHGEMFFCSPDYHEFQRWQGAFMPEMDMQKSIERIVQNPDLPRAPSFSLNFWGSEEDVESENNESKLIYERKPFDKLTELLPQAIILAIRQGKIAKSNLQLNFNIGYKRATQLVEKMVSLGLLQQLPGKLGWKLLPDCVDAIPKETLVLLESCGISEKDLENAYNPRLVSPNGINEDGSQQHT